jgi:hypothetical protein
MPAPVARAVLGALACVVLALASGNRLVRVAALLTAAGIVLAFFVPSQVGMNAIRLPALFAAPALVATSGLRPTRLAAAVVAILCAVPPANPADIASIGSPAAERAYYTELLEELDSVPLTGRVEIPPTQQRWESVYVADRFPLARGWMTQLDTRFGGVFFGTDLLHPGSYRRWLRANAVQYVAVPDAALSSAGEAEAELIARGLDYLTPTFRGLHWTVYRVDGATATVSGARLLSQDAVSVSFDAAAAGPVLVRVRWSKWLILSGPDACLRMSGLWTEVVVSAPGRYRLDSDLFPGDAHRECPVPSG